MDNNEDLAAYIAKSIVSVVSSNEELFRKALSITSASDNVELTASIISSVLRFSADRVPSNSNRRLPTAADSSLLKEFSSDEFSEFSDDRNECLDSSGVFSANPSVVSHEFSQDSDGDDYIPNYLQMNTTAPSFPFRDDMDNCSSRQNEAQGEFSQDSDFYSQELPANHSQLQQNADFSQDSDFDPHEPHPSYSGLRQGVELSQDSAHGSQSLQSNYRNVHQNEEFSQDSDGGAEQTAVNSIEPSRMAAVGANDDFSQDSDFESQEFQVNRSQSQQNAEFSQDSDIGSPEVRHLQAYRAQQLLPLAEFSQDSDFDPREPQPSYAGVNQHAEFSQDSDGCLEQIAANSIGPIRTMAVAGNDDFSQGSDFESEGRLNEFRQNVLPPQVREADRFSQESAVAQLTTAFDEFSQDED